MKISWQTQNITGWRAALDEKTSNVPTTAPTASNAEYKLNAGQYYFHLQGKDAAGKPTMLLNLPVTVAKPAGS